MRAFRIWDAAAYKRACMPSALQVNTIANVGTDASTHKLWPGCREVPN